MKYTVFSVRSDLPNSQKMLADYYNACLMLFIVHFI
jgi:hypothetical protein